MNRRPDDDHLLPPLYRAVHDTPGWRPGHFIADDHGRVAFNAEHPALGPSLIAAKRELWRGQVSITPKIVAAGLTHPRRTIIVAVGDEPTLAHAFAFDPRVVAKGERKTIRRSKRARNVPAFHVDPGRDGVLVSELSRGASVPRPRAVGGLRQATLREAGEGVGV